MLRFLLLIVALFALAFGFQRLKSTSGEVTVAYGDAVYAVDLTTAAIGLIIAFLAILLILAIIRAIANAPNRAARGWRRRNQERGRSALSHGLLAVASGDLRQAERAAQEAERRRADRPLTLLLQAQTAQLRGDRETARKVFEAMARDPETRVAGLRGLHIEAEREGDHRTARLIAEAAKDDSGTAPWAARALLRHQTAEGNWADALKTLSNAADGRILDKRTARRDRAVILTAQALDLEQSEPEKARAAALEAHDLAPDLVPAAVVAGRLLSRIGDIRRATRVLESTWKEVQHPEIAEAYAHVRPGDSALDRLKRAETLHRLRPHGDAGRLAVARAALDAREFGRAREALMPVITTRPTQNALILLAEIEEAETGDRGRAREWLARAVRAPRDAAWTADGMILEHWAPVSPVSGRLDAVEWKVPVAELEGPQIEIREDELRPPPNVLEKPVAPVEAEIIEPVEATPPDSPATAEGTEPSGTPAPVPPVIPSQPPVAITPGPVQAPAAPVPPAAPAPVTPTPVPAAEAGPAKPLTPPHLPDDPGVEPEEESPDVRIRRYS